MHARSILENIDPAEDYTYLIYAYDESDPIKKLAINMPAPYTLIQTKTLKKSIDSPRDFPHLARVIFHRFTALRDKGIDVFVQFDFMLGLPSTSIAIKTILVAYDLIPLIFKEDYIPTPTFAFRNNKGTLKKTKKTLRALYYQERYRLHYKNFEKADLLLSISNSTTESLITLLGIRQDRIATIPLAPVFNTDKAIQPHRLKLSKPFIFYIGATDARKRVSDLIKAFNLVRQKNDIELILAGKEFANPAKIPSKDIIETLENTPFRRNIHTLGYVNDAEKLWLYRNAKAFVFPSAYEGFGLPIVEALQNGCPVIAYDNSSIAEVGGNAIILTPTSDVAALAGSINTLLADTAMRDKNVKLGYTQSKIYTWKNYMNQFYQILRGLNEEN
ncbi:MAG: glycosyltransferase family 1 protein [Candidatus Saccharimonas sp.]